MEKIQTIKKSIRISELSAVASSISRSFKSFAIERQSLVNIIDDIDKQNSLIINSSSQSSKGMSVTAMDKARDKEVSTINTILKGYAAMKNAALSEPATALRSVLDRYLKAKITAKSFNEETGLILSLLGEFDTEENKKNVKALPGVEEALEDLKKAHEDFISYHDAKLAAQRDKAPSASSAKEPLLQAINERLVPVLNAALIEETKELLNFAAVVSTEISNVNASIANREKAAKKAKTEAETKKEAQTEAK